MMDEYYHLRDAVLHNMPEFIDNGAGALTWLAVFRDRWVSIFSPPFDCTVAHRRLQSSFTSELEEFPVMYETDPDIQRALALYLLLDA